jgi:signal transduction histidine kinase
MVTVFSLGIIFSAMVYNFAFYFYIRNKQYLYYALAQLSILVSLVTLEALQMSPFVEMYNFKNFYLLDISQTFILVFSLLFIQVFFQTDKQEKLNNVIKTILYLSFFDIFLSLILGHTFITKFIPTVIWIAFVLTEVFRHTKDKDVPFYFIMVGWNIVIVTLILELTYIIDPTQYDFPFLHVAFACESILLSFALSYKFRLIEVKQQKQQSLLLQQSRLASMGEMISIIAHQWRQPLNYLSYSFMHLKNLNKDNPEALSTIEDSKNQLQMLSKNIETFRNFYNPAKGKMTFSIYDSCQNILIITNTALKNLNIEVDIQVKEDFCVTANANEFEQVLLNLVNNAKDSFLEHKITSAKIVIEIQKPYIRVSDNAGGIPIENQKKIFEPYFSTKEDSDGIGLYIAKTIIENEMQGTLSLKSTHEGSEFTIKF